MIIFMSHNCHSNYDKPFSFSCLPPEQLLILSSAISLALSKNRTTKELETLINLSNLVNDNLTAILAQRIICNNSLVEEDITL